MMSNSRPTPAVYEFGVFRVDVEAGILFRGGEPTSLGPRAVAVLRVLLEHAGAPVSKETLIKAAWPGLAVCLNHARDQWLLVGAWGHADAWHWIAAMQRERGAVWRPLWSVPFVGIIEAGQDV